MRTSICVALCLIYIATGFAVVAVESKGRAVSEKSSVVLLLVVLWPAFPIGRTYRALVGGEQ